MKILAGAAALALLMTAPVLADPPREAIQVPGGSVEAVDRAQDADGASCVELMERAFYLSDPANLERTLDAHREMELARDAYQDGDEAACRRHAMHALEDRASL